VIGRALARPGLVEAVWHRHRVNAPQLVDCDESIWCDRADVRGDLGESGVVDDNQSGGDRSSRTGAVMRRGRPTEVVQGRAEIRAMTAHDRVDNGLT